MNLRDDIVVPGACDACEEVYQGEYLHRSAPRILVRREKVKIGNDLEPVTIYAAKCSICGTQTGFYEYNHLSALATALPAKRLMTYDIITNPDSKLQGQSDFTIFSKVFTE